MRNEPRTELQAHIALRKAYESREECRVNWGALLQSAPKREAKAKPGFISRIFSRKG